ncbi:piggyBac transposable element-derived protein 3-like [Polypterus senegalus]|uniref:piggyBac transposable element-derived protein 3-like n=1 Tax=Polypterus senegalus TaxID=55291 RepID=UPI001965248F|nr:piggyBac transposable element-derived protein 3-like [Polypterus senegalus]
MPKNRYLKIKSMLHFNDNSKVQENKDDRGFKVRPLIVALNKNFRRWGIFDKHLAVDEMIVKYYGHHGLKQFIRGKPIRFGYKFWALCGSSGYCFHFNLYCGKEVAQNERDYFALGSRVVLNMLDPVQEPASHWVFFDNLFTSRDLLIHLRDVGFRASGTLRQNRLCKCPLKDSKELSKEPRGTFDSAFDLEGEVLFMKWNDNNCVAIGTNFDTVYLLSHASRWSRTSRQKVSVPQPNAIKSYNKYMGGVDHNDWLVGKYVVSIRGKKWYWCLFTRMLDMAIVNAWIVYRKVSHSSMDLLEFRRNVAIAYLKRKTSKQGRAANTSSSTSIPDIRYDGKDHFVSRRDKQRRYQGENCNAKPLTFCKKCEVTLCKNCFTTYHTKK